MALSTCKKSEFIVFLKVLVKIALAVGLAAILSSCGTSPGYSYTVGGTVTGMVGSGLVLQNNLGDDEKITVNSVFSFPTALTDGAAYSVTVQTPPTSPSQTCVVSNGSGTINGAPVSNVIVNCTMSAGPVVVDPSNSFAYVSNFNSTNISAYAIQSGGSLSQITGPFTAGTNPNPVTFYPQTSGASAYYAYVSNVSSGMSSGTISAYSIDNSSGALNPICGGSTQPVCPSTGEYPTQVAVATVSGNTYAYVANMGDGTISAYSIDNSSGALTPLCGGSGTACPLAGTSPTSVIIDPNNKLAYVPNMISGTISVFAINDDGTLSLVETALAGTYPISITVAAETSGTYAYVANMGSNDICVYTIDYNYASDNVLPLSQGTTIGTQGTSPMSVTIYPQTGGAGAYYAYVSNVGSQNISVFTITGGALSTPALVTTGVNPNPVTIYVDSSTTPPTAYAYVSNMGDGTIYTYTIGSGLLTNPQITYLTTNILFPSISSPTTVTIDSQGPYAYVSDMSTGIVAAFTITTGSGPLGGQLTRVQ